MTTTYANRFDASETLSKTQERSLLTALGLGLVVTVLALAWAAVASRVEQSAPLSTASASESTTPMSDAPLTLRVEARSAQWLPDDASF